ncbi:hypothetical protein CY34DRAFT_19630 [Suillus luteus UH-Slu-Lm8-n1]|uniref:Uncharacterized protein n=1 Tax=Suillus luteus UH-Slu-Lm8-n1 TaxID=930992 RepID=A0A0D0AI68_9AGAM|nr:hypothetical protein CY34DRAFT_19630 [Suillus luteus UH-Slu-Lm8-n1]
MILTQQVFSAVNVLTLQLFHVREPSNSSITEPLIIRAHSTDTKRCFKTFNSLPRYPRRAYASPSLAYIQAHIQL